MILNRNKNFFLTMIYGFSFFGIITLITFNDFITIYVSLELFSYCTIILIYDKWRDLSKNLKIFGIIYFLINTLGSIFIIIYIYNIIKNMNTISINDIKYIINIKYIDINWFIIFALFIKLGIVPIHFWIIPIYKETNWEITLFISIIPKIIYFYIINYIFINYFYSYDNFYFFLSIITMLYGAILGINSYDIKRIIATSSIYNIGLIMIVLNSNIYKLPLFLYFLHLFPLLFIFSFFPKLKYFNFSLLSSLSLNFPFISLFLLFIIFSLIGIPPLSGFIYKIYIFKFSIFLNNFFWIICAIISTIISTIFYIYVIESLYSEKKIKKNNILFFNFNKIILFIFISFLIIFIPLYLPYLYFIII